MSFDFLSSYSHLPDDDLLNIVQNEQDYTHEAAQAARGILEKRGISATEILAGRQQRAAMAESTPEAVSNQLTNLSKQVNSLGLTRLETIYYAVYTIAVGLMGSSLSSFIYQLVNFFTNTTREPLITLTAVFQLALGFPMMFFGAIRHRWGWILLVVVSIAQLSCVLSRMADVSHWQTYDLIYFFPVLFNVAMMIYFFSKKCTSLFQLQPNDHTRAILIGLGFGALFVLGYRIGATENPLHL